MCVKFGIFLYLIKITKIRHISKKSDKLYIQHYRPITVLSVFSKILEKIIYHGLLSFLKKFSILAEEQNGFTKSETA